MDSYISLLTPAIAFFIAVGAPGPATLSLASTAMAAGTGAALRYSLGLTIMLAIWGAMAAAGLGPLLAESALALTVLKIAGGAYLLWLAWKSGRSALRKADAIEAPGKGHYFRQGFMLNAMNPKALVSWAAIIALGAGPETTSAEIWMIWAVCAITGPSVYVIYAFAFALPPFRKAYLRARRWIEGVTAILFGAAGISLLTWKAGNA